MRKHRILTLMLLSVALLSGCGAKDVQAPQMRTEVLKNGQINETIVVTGSVQPALRSELGFSQTGVVEEIFVEVGDEVSAGEVLATLDLEDVELVVEQAEINLQIQQISMDRLLAPPSEAEVAAASAAVNSAIASYNSVDRPSDPESVASAQMQVEQSYLQYLQLQNSLEDQWRSPNSVTLPLQERVQQSLIGVEIARLRLQQLQAGPDIDALTAASATIWEAQARLNGVLSPPSELTIERLQLQFQQAEIALNKAIELLGDRMIYAPFSGVISSISISPHNIASSSSPAITLIDRRNLFVQASVDEMDVGRIVLGQPVIVSFDALPGVVVNGQIGQIAEAPDEIDTGVVSYRVQINLEEIPAILMPGFTATARIIVNSVQDVLLVPNWAVRFDRETGEAFVNILSQEGSLIEQQVILGLRSEEMSEVLSGLEEGMTIGVSLESESLSPFIGGG